MTLPVRVVLVLTIALGLALARAQELVVVRDEWSATWTEGHKVSWSHVRIEHDPRAAGSDVAYVRSACTVAVVDGDARLTTSTWSRTDCEGRVLARRSVEEAPWGTTVLEVARVDSGTRFVARRRSLPAREGWLEQPPYDVDVMALRLLRGHAAQVSTRVPVFSSAHPSALAHAGIELDRSPDGTITMRLDGQIVEVR